MASAKFPGCDIINLDSDEEHGGDERGAEEVFRRLDDESMSLSVHFSPVNQSEIGDSSPCFHFVDSNSDSGSGFLDPHSCLIDFFNRESYEVDRGRGSSSGDSNLWSFYRMDEDIDLGLGIGSRSGSGPIQLLGEENLQVIDLDGESDNVNMDSDLVTGLIPLENNLFVEEEAMMVADEELEWENLQNAIFWDPEPTVQGSLFALEEEDRDREGLSLASRDDQHDNLQVLLDASIVIEEDDGVMMDFSFNDYIASIDVYGENDGDYDAFLFGNESVIRGSPPASKRVVEDLPVVEITSEELRDGNIVCAICKDDVEVEEKVKRLPCRHYYHGECIIPWLGIRNTCPVCRYELPTDDVEYERNRRTQRRGLVVDLMSE